jgi:predicted alpha/beta superfamily hydrolase
MSVAYRLLAAMLLAVCGDVAAQHNDAAAANPKRRTAASNVHVLAPLPMAQLGRERTIRVYLPPGYEASRRRYPVLYLQDGQNLFDAATSFLGEWNVDETLNDLARERGIELIVVGIDNGGDHRMQELAPLENAKQLEPEGDAYLAFVVDTVKPYVDAHYRTRPERADTAIGGSSLGALISHYAMYRHPQTFGKALLFSPSYWYTPEIYAYSAKRRLPPSTRLYFYAGGAEDEHMVRNMQRMIAVLRANGLASDAYAEHVVTEARHNEAAWRAEFGRAVVWLFGDQGR